MKIEPLVIGNVTLYQSDCLNVLPNIESSSVDCIITDPPYPEIDRSYGCMTEDEWWDMMMDTCRETRRILRPSGSAVFILQPNSRKVGSMRGWLWEFMAWVCREWNMIQDVWWWNIAQMPSGVCTPHERNLLRESIRSCVWTGSANCFRNQDTILWEESDGNKAHRLYRKALYSNRRNGPSGNGATEIKSRTVVQERGGSTPFNLIPIPTSRWDSGAYGHGAGTPLELAKWWTRYICPPGGTILDPFVGSGTMMLAALAYGCKGIGIDKMPEYIDIAAKRVAEAQQQLQFDLGGKLED